MLRNILVLLCLLGFVVYVLLFAAPNSTSSYSLSAKANDPLDIDDDPSPSRKKLSSATIPKTLTTTTTTTTDSPAVSLEASDNSEVKKNSKKNSNSNNNDNRDSAALRNPSSSAATTAARTTRSTDDSSSSSSSRLTSVAAVAVTSPSVASSSSSATPRLQDYTLGPEETFPALDGNSMDRVHPGERGTVLRKPRARFGWKKRLNTPTYVGFQLGYWWIVDCWHHRVLYRKRGENETDADLDAVKDFDPSPPSPEAAADNNNNGDGRGASGNGGAFPSSSSLFASRWKTLKVANASWMVIPHSIATDGQSVLMIESSIGGSQNGREHSILVFEKIPSMDHPLRKYGAALRAAKKSQVKLQDPGAGRPKKNILVDRGQQVTLTSKATNGVEVLLPDDNNDNDNNNNNNNNDQHRPVLRPRRASFNSSSSNSSVVVVDDNDDTPIDFDLEVASMLDAYGEEDDFILVQRLIACPPPRAEVRRPHRLVFDEEIKAFFLYITSPGALARFDLIFSSIANQSASASAQAYEDSQSLKRFGRIKPRVAFDFCKILLFMAGGYARSISLVPVSKGVSHLFITLGPGVVNRISHRLINRTTPESAISVSAQYYTSLWKVRVGSMNDIFYFNGFYYISQTNKCAVFRQKTLAVAPRTSKSRKAKEISAGARKNGSPDARPENIRKYFNLCRGVRFGFSDMCVGGGTPYFFSSVGNRVYMTYIFGCSGVYSFVPSVDGNDTAEITDVKHHFEKIGWMETVDDIVARGLVW